MIVRASTLNELEDGINRTASVGFTLASSIHGLRVRVSDLEAEHEFKLVVVMKRRKRCLARATGHSATTEMYISMTYSPLYDICHNEAQRRDAEREKNFRTHMDS